MDKGKCSTSKCDASKCDMSKCEPKKVAKPRCDDCTCGPVQGVCKKGGPKKSLAK